MSGIIACAVSVAFVGEVSAGTPADQLRPFGHAVVRPPWHPLYAFRVLCSALPCRIRLTERAFVQGRHVAALDRLGGPTIVMSQQPPAGQIFVVWFERSDFNQHLLTATVNRYGSVQLHIEAVSTDAQGDKVTAKRTVSLLPTLSVVGCADPNADTTSGEVKPSTCIFHQANTGYYSYTMAAAEGLNWTGWGSPVATASGTLLENMGYRPSVTVRLSGLRACPRLDEKVYTELAGTDRGPLGVFSWTWQLERCV